ncbi:hypothetical protein ACIOGZ_28665 [Kitasatospora sp. NPDC088160]|uniref:hypothetical protein n=1 Tax=Kitasatospora sp. NPDC088160 TaxID=3364072 RepID=UPI003806F1E0
MPSAGTAGNRSSARLRAAHVRKDFTGETLEVALAGIGRKNTIGLDACSPAQREFRALLALSLFNRAPAPGEAPARPVSNLGAHDAVISPRWNELVIVAQRSPADVVAALIPGTLGDGPGRAPGLLLVAASPGNHSSTFHLQHQPTGARLVVTGRPGGPKPPRPEADRRQDPHGTADELTADERARLDGSPPVSPDAAVLLAGLTCRYNLEDHTERWATSWTRDPFGRANGWGAAADHGPVERQLSGRGDMWVLRWNGYPYRPDLARAFTHPVIGIQGAELHIHRQVPRVTFGTAFLELRGPV